MRRRWRWGLGGAALLLLLLAGLLWWLVQGFDSERFKRVASDWTRSHYQRELVFDGPVRLQLWPQPAVALQQLRLSEPGRPEQPFMRVEQASLSLKLQPLLSERRIEVDSISARGVTLRLQREAGGRRNVDDLLDLAAGSGSPAGAERSVTLQHLELADVQLQIEDHWAGVHGALAIARLELGAFGPGLRAPLQLQAQVDLRQPHLQGRLQLQAGLELLPAAQRGAPPIVQLDQAGLQLSGEGFEFEGLQASLQARTIRLEYGAAEGTGDSRAELHDTKLQFSGRRLGWQVDSGELQLARLQLDMLQRSLELQALALQLKGRRGPSTLDASLSWPQLSVQGERLQGSALQGALQLGGDRQLQMQLRSQAPGGSFERVTLPGLHLSIDGQHAGSTVSGQVQGTLVFEPQPQAAELSELALRLSLSGAALPALQIALDGSARLTPDGASGRLAGTLNEQPVDGQLDLQLGGERPRFQVQARFQTLDLNRFMPPALRGAAPATATATATATASPPVDLQLLRLADARLDIGVARLLRAPYRIDGLELQAHVDNGVLELRRASGRAWGGSFNASGRADAGNGRLTLRLRAEQIDMRALLADTVGYDGLRGRARIDADLQGGGATHAAVLASLSGTARLSLQPAALRGVDLGRTLRGWRTATQDHVASDAAHQTDFSSLEGSFTLRNGVARNDDLSGRSEFLRVSGEGTVDLAQQRLDYLLRARVVNTAGIHVGPEMMMLNGVTVPVQLNGPFGGVEWQVNWAAVTAAVAALSVPNVARGAVGTAARGVSGVVRGAAGVLRSLPGAASATNPPPR